jgi:uncharacterized protein YndB with AHSA1/START domain
MNAANGMATAIKGRAEGMDDREVTVTRVIKAPRELVFDAWTQKHHVAHWWRPAVFAEVHVDEMEVKPGGLLRLRMITPEHVTYNSRCVYREISAPQKLVYDETCDEGGRVFHQARQTITFADQGNDTLLTVHARLSLIGDRDPRWSLEAMRAGWSEGWNDNLDKLEGYLPDANHVHSPGKALVLQRYIAAPRELVFQAWADPKQMGQWYGPTGFTCPVCEGDVRLGGAWRLTMRAPNGDDYPLTGTYVEIDPPRKLVIDISLENHPPQWHEMIRDYRVKLGESPDAPEGLVRMTVELEERNGGTWLTVTDSFTTLSERDAHRDLGAVEGWTQTVDRLAAHVVQQLDNR